MAALPIITQNSDFVLKVNLTDVEGNAIAISGIAQIKIAIYQKKENLLQVWDSSQAGQVTTVSDSGGIISVNVDRANIAGLKLERIYAEISVAFTNSNFEYSLQWNTISDIPLCDLLNSAITN